ncbi:TIGR01457 family HAD-type hydrolase [Paludifilum halophilum]|uniref:TIGR01457 family HAD-type hydrolase n=1 Tax=Paludifilum halophilum TaxID=1642702 RepID=A0A235B5H7_9BACL|nr:TIGR01457 family HAD-type hydrolase [Paludifilum halophilum]OYD07229.1 TIGR01457 family HAD-type hydrolase [Paludifilum halophilum]
MTRYRGYLIDLDGTLYRGREVIPSGLEFVRRLEELGIPYLFFTNNSSRRPDQVAEKLRTFGYAAEGSQVVTSAVATAQHLKRDPEVSSVYAIGENGLITALHEAGLDWREDRPDAVIVGIDRGFHYEKMKTACLAIRAGARFFGTNGDLVLPTEEGLTPGNGSLCTGIASATGVDPVFIGKPEPPILEFALQRLGTSRSETLIVGDNLSTDILAGVKGGVDSLLVFSGVTTPEESRRSSIQATHTVDDLKDWDFI